MLINLFAIVVPVQTGNPWIAHPQLNEHFGAGREPEFVVVSTPLRTLTTFPIYQLSVILAGGVGKIFAVRVRQSTLEELAARSLFP